MALQANISLRILDRYTRHLARLERHMIGIGRAVERANIRSTASTRAMLKAYRKDMERIRVESSKVRGQILGTAVAAAAIAFPLKEAIQFEAAFVGLTKLLRDDTPEALARIKGEVMGLTKTIPKSGKELLALMEIGAKSEVAQADLAGFAGTIAKIGVALDIENVEMLGKDMAKVAVQYGLAQAGIENLTDAVNTLGDTSAAQVPGMLEILRRTSGTFKGLKMPPEIVAGWAAHADIIEVTPRLAASGLNQMVEGFRSFGPTAEGMVNDPLNTMLKGLGILSKLDPQRQFAAVREIFGEEGARFVEKMLPSLDKLQERLDTVSDKTIFAGSVSREFNRVMATTEKGIELTGNAWHRLNEAVGAPYLEGVEDAADGTTEFLDTLTGLVTEYPKVIKRTGLAIAGLIGLRLAFLITKFVGLQFWATMKTIGVGIKLLAVGFRLLAFAIFSPKKALFALGNTMLILRLRLAAMAIATGLMAAASGVATAAAWLFNAALWANPLTWIVIAIIAAVAAIVLLWIHWDKVSAFLLNVWGKMRQKFGGLMDVWLAGINLVLAPLRALIAAWEYAHSLFAKTQKMPLPRGPENVVDFSAGNIAGLKAEFASRQAGTSRVMTQLAAAQSPAIAANMNGTLDGQLNVNLGPGLEPGSSEVRTTGIADGLDLGMNAAPAG